MKILHSILLPSVLAASACASIVPDRAGTGPSWVDERAAEAGTARAPVHVPLHRINAGEIIQVAATTRQLVELGNRVRARADAIMDEPVDTESYARAARERAVPPAPDS